MASSHGDLRHLLPTSYKRLISEWLEEDCPSFDYGGFVVGESEGEAKLLGKSEVRLPSFFFSLYRNGVVANWRDQGIIAGVPFFDEVFSQLGCSYVSDKTHLDLTPPIQTKC